MGGKYEVEFFDSYNKYNAHTTVYLGNSLIKALWYLWQYRNAGSGCVVFCYRRSK